MRTLPVANDLLGANATGNHGTHTNEEETLAEPRRRGRSNACSGDFGLNFK